jgi:hypothetical protein
MSRYLVWLADGRSNTSEGSAPQVLLTLNDPVWGANTWSISQPNGWIGTGQEEYKVVKIPYTASTSQVQGGVRFVLVVDNYPGGFSDDADNSSGVGWYVSPYTPGLSRSLRWFSYGTIRPEPS